MRDHSNNNYRYKARFEMPDFALCGRLGALAVINGNKEAPQIHGQVEFYQTTRGVVVTARIGGLPDPETDNICTKGIFGLHIHEKGNCNGVTGVHFDDVECPHPYHSGDLPPLFGNHGLAYMSVLSDRFTVDEIIGKTVIIHSAADDLTSQPTGDSGVPIACGFIQRR